MPVKLGYGGVANTNGARDFTGKEIAVVDLFKRSIYRYAAGFRTFLLLWLLHSSHQ